ncbi:MAG: tetratricopeptide repeat protein, partial [Planctomycetaceae bacterium]|nr:tetratricopeptide repeat protein [Planctomycetaceae bacterium]
MIKRFFGSAIIFFCFSISLCLPAFADGGAENLVLVVNRKQPESLALANQYIDLRKVPASHVVYIDFDLKNETTSVDNFKKNILMPVFAALEKRQLKNQINCIVYSSGFPTRVTEKKYLEGWLKKTGQKYNIQLHAPWCSINALTYYYQQVLEDDLDFFALDSNQYFRKPIVNLLEEPFSGNSQRIYENALTKMRPQEYGEAIKLLSQLAKSHPDHPVVKYQIARSYALNNQYPEAMEALKNAVAAGWYYRTATAKDNAFFSMRKQANFKNLLSEMPNEPIGMLPSRQFRNEIKWDQNGWPTSSNDAGRRYIISTMLGVSPSIGGTASLQENLAQIERTALADGTRPNGTFFFANHKDVRSRSRASQFEYAVKELQRLGYSAEIIKTTMPKNQEVLGATLGSAKIPWSDS